VAKLIAVEWDRRELRVLAGQRKGTQLQVDHALTYPLTSSSSEESESGASVTSALGQALNALRVAKGEAIVSVGRANVELRTLQVPPAEVDDLPDIVRFQAMKQFASLTETTPLDFVNLPDMAGASSSSVLAVSLNQATLKEIQKTCSDAGLEVTKIVLRPFAVTQLLEIAEADLKEQNLLMVDLLGDEADLTIVEKGDVVFIRSVKLPSEDEAVVGPWLVGEMRRTLMAAASQRNGLKIDRVIVWAHQSVADSLSDRAAGQLQLPIQVIDPFANVRVEESAKREIGEGRKSRFAPLLGVLVGEAAGKRQLIDFVNPRRRPPKKRPIMKYALAGGAAAALLLGSLWWYRSSHSSLDYQLADLRKTTKDLDQLVAVAQQNIARHQEVDKFVRGDVNWLDELSRLAEKLPNSKDVILRDTTMSLRGGNSVSIGEISTTAFVNRTEVGPQLEQQLRDTYHKVEGKNAQRATPQIEGYPWSFKESIAILPQEKSAKASPKPQAPEAAKGDAKAVTASTEKPAAASAAEKPQAVLTSKTEGPAAVTLKPEATPAPLESKPSTSESVAPEVNAAAPAAETKPSQEAATNSPATAVAPETSKDSAATASPANKETPPAPAADQATAPAAPK
jgi:Tfp pilus assembly PilM family ATPase